MMHPLLCLLFFLIVCYHSSAQRAKIEILKHQLSSVRDSARADCLNVLSLAYAYLHADTAKLYAQKAYDLAASINYQRGIIMALNNNAHIAGFSLHDYPLQEKISSETIQLYANRTTEKALAETYMNLALALFCQSYFDRCSEICSRLILLSKNTSDSKTLGETFALLGCIHLETGNYEKCFEYLNQSMGVFKSASDNYNTAIVLSKLGDLYNLAGDHKTALHFYFQSLQFPKGPSLLWHPLVDLGDTYYMPEQYDSAAGSEGRYIQSIKWLTIRSNYTNVPDIRKAEVYMAAKEFNKALQLLIPALGVYTKANDRNQVMRILLAVANAYEGIKQYNKAEYFAKMLLQNGSVYSAKQYLRDGYRLMSNLYDKQLRTDSAYFYYRQYTNMKDSVAMDEFKKKLAMYKAASETEKKQAQIELLKNEKLIGQQQLQISGQQLQGQAFQKNMLIAGILLLLFLGLIIFRNIKLQQKNEASRHKIIENELSLQKLESERSKSELQQRATELEMQALRAQMNPHFIFNSLNSINRFIIQNNKDKASEYLSKFSRLIRLILQNSQSSLIPLESELEALQVYIELEAVRFDYHFDFEIYIAPDLDTAALKVPPLIIQPYAENAIWHGLMHKEEKGHLRIGLFEDSGILYCKIADDGIGRQKAVALKSKSASTHKSMGMQITASRIAILQQEKDAVTQIKITDLVLPDGTPGGTEVLINIPVCYD